MYCGKVWLIPSIPEVGTFNERTEALSGEVSELLAPGTYATVSDFQKGALATTVRDIKLSQEACQIVFVATITEIIEGGGWFYIACKKCNNKVTAASNVGIDEEGFATEGSIHADISGQWLCSKYDTTTCAVSPRFKVQVRMCDGDDFVTITLFEREVYTLISKTTYELREEACEAEGIPSTLEEIIGKSCLFRVSVEEYNIIKKHHVYTAARISDSKEFIKAFATNVPSDSAENLSPEFVLRLLPDEKHYDTVAVKDNVMPMSLISPNELSIPIAASDAFAVQATESDCAIEGVPLKKVYDKRRMSPEDAGAVKNMPGKRAANLKVEEMLK